MTKYLLLRDNKQSGPYSCDDLRTKGLKAYDLVWVEGKSAAWRYPSEVEELRSFAPVVEEQPFDRFYKRPSQVNTNTSQVGTHTAAVAAQASQPVTISTGTSSFPGETSAIPGKRIIYVTLPAARNLPAARETGTREPARSPVSAPEKHTTTYNNQAFPQSTPASSSYDNSASYDKGASRSEITPGYDDRRFAAEERTDVPGISEKRSSTPGLASIPAEDILSQSWEDRRTAVEITPRRKMRRSTPRLWQPLLVAGCVLVLLAAGVFIGLSINKDSLGFAKKLALKKDGPSMQVIPPDNHQEASRIATVPVPAPVTSAAGTDSIKRSAPVTAAPLPSTQRTSPAPARDGKAKTTSNLPKAQMTAIKNTTPPKDSAVITYPVVQREASHRSDLSVEKMDKDLIRNNVSNLVSIGASHYTVGAFGGISNLQLTISNRSIYALDLVVVEVQYIQSNKKVFKTENLYFRGIGAGAALMQEAPKSTRGIKVQYKITLVNSKELGLSYSAL